MMRLAVTSAPRVGKTTLCTKVAEELKRHNIGVGGIISTEMREHGIRAGFAITDISTAKDGTRAHMKLQNGPRGGKYTVNLEDLEAVAAGAIRNAAERMEFVIIDEIAPMELKSDSFIEAVTDAITTDKHILASLHQKSNHYLVKRIREKFKVITLTRENRDIVTENVLDKVADETWKQK